MNKLIENINDFNTYFGVLNCNESFYENFEFISSPNEDLGAGMIWYNN